MYRLLAAPALLLMLATTPGSPALAQVDPQCADATEAELQRLPLGDDTVTSIQYERKLNPRDQGPEVIGMRAWVRLQSCTGYLVIDMTRSCFVRQSYTRGNCVIEGVTQY